MLSESDIILRLVIATLFGLAIGFARRSHPAGLRTFTLICLGSAMYTVISMSGLGGGDPSRIAAQVVTGIGFLGAGVIWKEKGRTTGLTTAAGIWATAALGLFVGFGMWSPAITSLLIILLVFYIKKLTRKDEKARVRPSS